MTQKQAAYRQYLKSEHWAIVREQVLERDNRKCVRCPSRKFLQAHHTFYRPRWEDTRVEDCITLCERCHKIEHGIEFRKPVESGKDILKLLEKYERFVIKGRNVARRFRRKLSDALPMCPPDIQYRINAMFIADKNNKSTKRYLRETLRK